MNITKQILSVALLGLLITACKNTDYKKTKDGNPYKVYGSGKGDKILPGNIIRFHRTDRLGDSLLGTSYGGPAQFLPIPKDTAQLAQLSFILDATKGDSILLIQPVDSIIAKNPMAANDSFLVKNKGKEIRTFIKIVEVFKDEATARAVMEQEQSDMQKKQMAEAMNSPEVKAQKAKDEAAIDAYLKSNNITAKKTELGTYVQTLSPGNGQRPKDGQFAMVRYTGKDLTGKEFDSNNKPGGQLLPVQIGGGGVIPGFGDGVSQLSKGEKAVLYIPSVLGYGAQGMPPRIAPNQSLIFEIEVVDITDSPSAPSAPTADSTSN
ncbi:MAG TPA: FKBP-type peptidyl-prolyl cis-trans isomerase [Flavisolibacter sp.]|nr:FKBP-type peptidyl-prolyl cis-trans isomerase [Flavisolibacter sp.]